jgi:hypothetical protein
MSDWSGKNDPAAALDPVAALDFPHAGPLLTLFLIFKLLFCN